MKEVRRNSFSKVTIYEEDGEFMVEEKGKEQTYTYCLSDVLREWIDLEDVSITIQRDLEVLP